MPLLVATNREVVVIDIERGTSAPARGIDDRPTCLAADPLVPVEAWCGTCRGGAFRSDDGGRSWTPAGLAGRFIMAMASSPVDRGMAWAGTEPSEIWRLADAGATWDWSSPLEDAPRHRRNRAFPARPDTHHVALDSPQGQHHSR